MEKIIIPENIEGIDYNLIKEFNEMCDKHLNRVNELSEDTIIRLIPPYIIPCCQKVNGCQKDAGFLMITNNNYYCWMHMHSKIN